VKAIVPGWEPVTAREIVPSFPPGVVGFVELFAPRASEQVGGVVVGVHAITQLPAARLKPEGQVDVGGLVIGPETKVQVPPKDVQSEPPSQYRGVLSEELT